VKAVLSDQQTLNPIKAISSRNLGLEDSVKTLATIGLRPVDLQHVSTRTDTNGTP
jgi:hypothetical protein